MNPLGSSADNHGPNTNRNAVHAVGIGPGDLEYLTPKGRRMIRQADVVVGFESVIDFISELTDADLLACSYETESETLDRFGERVADGAMGVAVFMGDPNVSGYQFLAKVEDVLDRPVTVLPGISSIQIAASYARTPLEESTFVTLHKRGAIDEDLQILVRDAGDRHLLVLPRPYDWMPGDIADRLVSAGVSNQLPAVVFERLTLDNQTVHESTLGELADVAGGNGQDDTPFSDLTVLVIKGNE